MALTSHLGFIKGCGCESCVPDVAKFAERLDAVGGDRGKLTFATHFGGVEKPTTFDLGSRQRGAPPIAIEWTTVRLRDSEFTIETKLTDVPDTLRPDEVEAIVSELTRRFDQLLRAALSGGPQ